MVTDLEVAQVLEDAATLYEDEKIEWCTNNWARKGVKWLGSGYVPVVSMCAEGAMMTAAGFTVHQVLDFQENKATEVTLATMDHATYAKFCSSRRALQEVIGGYVTSWNDSQRPESGKAVVIETMRTVAKDLRNRAPAVEL